MAAKGPERILSVVDHWADFLSTKVSTHVLPSHGHGLVDCISFFMVGEGASILSAHHIPLCSTPFVRVKGCATLDLDCSHCKISSRVWPEILYPGEIAWFVPKAIINSHIPSSKVVNTLLLLILQ